MYDTTDPVEVWFQRFGVDEDLIGPALAAATAWGADHAELYFQHSATTSLGMSDRAINRAHTSVDLGVGVRVVVGDQVGYAYTEDLDREAVLRAARTAAQIARAASRPAPPAAVASRRGHPSWYPLSRSWQEVELDERLPLLRRWEEATFARDPRVRKVEVSLADAESRELVGQAVRVSTDGKRNEARW